MQVLLCGAMRARGGIAGRVRDRGAVVARLVRVAARAVADGGRAKERGRGDVQPHLHVCVPVGAFLSVGISISLLPGWKTVSV